MPRLPGGQLSCIIALMPLHFEESFRPVPVAVSALPHQFPLRMQANHFWLNE